MLAEMACSGNDEALKVLLDRFREQDSVEFLKAIERVAAERKDGSLYFELGTWAARRHFGNAQDSSIRYLQRGAFLGSIPCRLRLIRLRLNYPQPDLDLVERVFSALADSSLDEGTAAERDQVVELFVKRCKEAIEIDCKLIDVCREPMFRDEPEAKFIIARYERLSQWIAKHQASSTPRRKRPGT